MMLTEVMQPQPAAPRHAEPAPPAQPGVHAEAERYLSNLQSLAQELDRAMNAVVTGQVPAFEDSVIRQRNGCAQLVQAQARSSCLRHPEQDGSPLDPDLAGRIAAAASTLNNLNQRYSALLKHSGETMRLFAGLFRTTYGGPSAQAAGGQSHLRTWSCEL